MGTQLLRLTMWKHAPSRERLGRVAAVLDDARAGAIATNDVLWDEVVASSRDGDEEVFDATVLGTHNFIADGVAVHNSIEQDADMVILLHREDAYEKESPRAGEADFIVAKHRNGPTDDDHRRLPGPLQPVRRHGPRMIRRELRRHGWT